MSGSQSPSAHHLRQFYDASCWPTTNLSYAQLTHSSRNLIDFVPPHGLLLSLSHRPTPLFASSLLLSTLVPAHSHPLVLAPPPSPLLAAQFDYVFSSAPFPNASTKRTAHGPDRVDLKTVTHAFHPGPLPVKPQVREQPTWLAGNRVDKRDYFLFGRLYAPSPRLDALYVHRLSRTFQVLLSLISVPSPVSPTPLSWQQEDAPPPPPPPVALTRASELELSVMHDTGRWSAQYSYAVADGMWGARGLYNFGKSGSGESPTPSSSDALSESAKRERVVDEEEELSTGLKGRWSAGGEVYFSAQERSAGCSAGVRFATVPSVVDQPPTTITATVSPIMGQVEAAYCVATGKDSALASRFDFNLYSYDAEVSVGGEWYQRKRKPPPGENLVPEVEKRADWDAFGRGVLPPKKVDPSPDDEVTGVLKASMSTTTDISLMWQGRLGDFLVSLGVTADLKLATESRTSPIRNVGIGVSYWA